MHRLFVAIRPPEPIRDTLVDAMDDSADLRWVSEDNLHLTLRFIGEVERPLANDIADSLGSIRIPPFQLRVAGVGRFDRRNGGVIWAGVEPRDRISALAAKIDRACVEAGLEPEPRAFHPHISIAQWTRSSRTAAEIFLRSRAALASNAFEVSSFNLVESHLSRHGAHHEYLAGYRLSLTAR